MPSTTDYGPLDRTGVLYSNQESISGSGNVVSNLERIGPIYLTLITPSVRTVLAGTRDADGIDNVYRSRWFAVKNGMVIKVDGMILRIIRHVELGRREGLDLYCHGIE